MRSETVKKVILVGRVEKQPRWIRTDQSRVLCVHLLTDEVIGRGDKAHLHTERHTVMIHAFILKSNIEIKHDDMLFVQGKLETKVIRIEDVVQYKTHVVATDVDLITELATERHVLTAV